MKAKKLLVNDKVDCFSKEVKIKPEYKKPALKLVRHEYKFLKPTIAIRYYLHQIYPSVPSFVSAVLLITSFNVLSGYFNVSPINLVAVPTVWMLDLFW